MSTKNSKSGIKLKRGDEMIINGKKVKTNGYFAYEGCHKMYVCESDADVEMMRGYGCDILPIAELPKTYKRSCPLKFISSANLKTTYCPQCREAKFSGRTIEKSNYTSIPKSKAVRYASARSGGRLK